MIEFETVEEMCLSCEGRKVFVGVVDLTGRAAPVQYRRAPGAEPRVSKVRNGPPLRGTVATDPRTEDFRECP